MDQTNVCAEMDEISFVQIAETASDIIIITKPDLAPPGPVITYVNPAFSRLTGYSSQEVIGLTPRILQGPGTDRATLVSIGAALRGGRPVHERLLNFAKHGAPYWLDIRISALRNEAGRITHFVAIERDVTMEMRRIDELEFIADRDTLTGIPNRGAFQRVLGAEIARIEAGGGAPASAAGLCVAFINVDNFKRVNGAFGRATGNAALVVLAECIADNVRRSDLLGRIGGQEFAVCMPGITLDCAESFAERLRYAVTANPLKTVSGPVRLTVSVGVAIFSAGDSVPSMMMRAANAMCAAKRDGGNSVRIQLPRFA